MKNEKLKSLLLLMNDLDSNSEIENINDKMGLKVRGGLSARARNRSGCNDSNCNNSNCGSTEIVVRF